MRSNFWMRTGLLAALALNLGLALAAPAKHAVELPPSADLAYELTAQQRGFGLKGDAQIAWRADEGKYDVNVEASVSLLGKLTEYRSHGTIDAYGLAPSEFYEKRYRKEATTTSFDREGKTIAFTEGKEQYTMKGGEQDRASVTWQLASVARAAGATRFKPGSEWTFIVAGRRDAEPGPSRSSSARKSRRRWARSTPCWSRASRAPRGKARASTSGWHLARSGTR
nr:DUF3108 domain-containing protein [Massilia sp. Se16.2.3]